LPPASGDDLNEDRASETAAGRWPTDRRDSWHIEAAPRKKKGKKMTDPRIARFFMDERQKALWRMALEEQLSREARATEGERGQSWLRRWASTARTRLHSRQTEPLRAPQAAKGHTAR
jgi:hypothetical protein